MNKSVGWFFGIGALGISALVLVVVLAPRAFTPKSRVPAAYAETFISAAQTKMTTSEIEKRAGIPDAARVRAVYISTVLLTDGNFARSPR